MAKMKEAARKGEGQGRSSHALSVKQAAGKIHISEGHLRRVLNYPRKYTWKDFGIVYAYKAGRSWCIVLEPREQKLTPSKKRQVKNEAAASLSLINQMPGLRDILPPGEMEAILAEHEIAQKSRGGCWTPEELKRLGEIIAARIERKPEVIMHLVRHVNKLLTDESEERKALLRPIVAACLRVMRDRGLPSSGPLGYG